MAIIQRPTKQGGATTFQGKIAQGYTKILASEADADIDTIFAAWNGGADTVNIRDNAITSAKLAPGAVGARELADGSIGLGEINQTSLAAWVPSGVGIAPADGTRNVVIPGSTAVPQADLLVGGARTVKGRLNANAPSAAVDAVRLTLNRNNAGAAGVADDNTLPTWEAVLRLADDFRILRSAPGAPATQTALLTVLGTDGKTYCTLADASILRAMISPGHACAGPAATVGMPTSFSVPATSTWTRIAITPAMANRGGLVFVLCNPGISTVLGGNTTMYLQLQIDTTPLATFKISSNVSTGLSGIMGVTTPAAGSHTYSLWGWLAAGAMVTAADNGGALWAVEFS